MKPITHTLIALLITLASAEILAARTDVVYLYNGDRITGEVKGVYSGQLEFKTDEMGTIMINWQAIRQLISDKVQQVKLSDGSHLTGKLGKVPSSNKDAEDLIRVQSGSAVTELNADQVVGMYPVHGDFFDRSDFNLSLGFNYDLSSDVGKYNLGMTGRYRTENSITSGRLSSEFTTQDDRDTTKRNMLSLMHMMDLPEKRYRNYFGNLEQNEQLGVKFRTVIGTGYGWVPISSGRNWLTYGLGLAVNFEQPYGDNDAEENLEGVGSIRFEHYKRSVPKRILDSYFRLMPSLTQSGRVRSDLTLDFNWEIFRDFFVGMETYAAFDNQPAAEDASEYDFGIISKIGYSF